MGNLATGGRIFGSGRFRMPTSEAPIPNPIPPYGGDTRPPAEPDPTYPRPRPTPPYPTRPMEIAPSAGLPNMPGNGGIISRILSSRPTPQIDPTMSALSASPSVDPTMSNLSASPGLPNPTPINPTSGTGREVQRRKLGMF